MRNLFTLILIGLLFGELNAQRAYRSVDDIQGEWTEYTSYQKEEIISFCDFLFKEGYYERCLLTSFQLLYKFQNDPITPVVNYYIARCYEEMKNYDLASRYYQQVMDVEDTTSITYIASNYRNMYVTLLEGDIEFILESTSETIDPYLITFRGYAFMKKLNWEKARTSFIMAQSIFDHSHYNKLMTPLYQTIENVSTVPRHNKYLVFLVGSIIPGGGQFMLRDWDKGQGIFTSVSLLALIGAWGRAESLVGRNSFIESEATSIPLFSKYNGEPTGTRLINRDKIPSKMSISSSSFKYIVPPMIFGTGIFLSGTIKSFDDTQLKNERLVDFYIQERIDEISPSRFLDFPEPTLIVEEK